MAPLISPRALLFDVFGTCVNWRATVTQALHTQAQVALSYDMASIASHVRWKASTMTQQDWARLAQQWRQAYKEFTRMLAADPTVAWKTIDEHHLDSLRELLSEWGLDGLWNDEEVQTLSLVWHRLEPWPDSTAGIRLLNMASSTATLSNGNVSLLEDLTRHASLDFMHIFSAEMFGSYKPSPKVYLGGVERLGREPHECAMVAAHLNDLEAARANGLQTIYVERPGEEEWDDERVAKARADGWVDIWVEQNSTTQGFVTVAEQLGISPGAS